MPHHPDIQSAIQHIAQTDPSTAGRFSIALNVLLRAVETSNDPQAWRSSHLTGDGFPLEITFTTADGHLRYTVDPGGCEMPMRERLGYAVSLLNELGQPPANPEILSHLAGIQKAAPDQLHYGAWTGGRHRAGRTAGVPAGAPWEDRYKIYVEAPESDPQSQLPFITPYLDPPPRLYNHPLLLRMAALEPASGRMELYFRTNRLETAALTTLLHPVGLRARADELADFIEQAYSFPLNGQLPGGSVGFSYSLIPGQQPAAFSLFLFTRLLWGGDARIRQRFAERLQANGQDPALYQQITAPLAERDVHQTYHGLLGFVVSTGAPIHLSLGVRPPPVTGTQ